MSDKPNDIEAGSELTVEQGYRLKHEIEKSITCGPAIAAGMLAFYAVAALFRREGHREGYMDGYDSGFSEGINKAYAIDEKEAMDIHDRAIDMQFDERVIKAFDEKKQTG